MHRFENMERLRPLLETHADQLGYVRVSRLMALDNASGNRERGIGRVDWTDADMERLKLPPEPAQRPLVVSRYVQELVEADTLKGQKNRFRVRGYAPTASNHLFDLTIHCLGEEETELTTVPPVSLLDVLKSEGLSAASEVIELVLDSAKRAARVSSDVTEKVLALQRESQTAVLDFYRVELSRAHAALAEKDKLIARLSERSMHRDREELERAIERIEGERAELGEKAKQGEAMDRLERIGSMVFGIKDLSPKARELLPLLGQDDIVQFLGDPNIANVLKDPDQRRAYLDTLRATMAEATAENAEPEEEEEA